MLFWKFFFALFIANLIFTFAWLTYNGLVVMLMAVLLGKRKDSGNAEADNPPSKRSILLLFALSFPFLLVSLYIVAGWAAFVARYASACSQTPGVEQHWLYYLFGFGFVWGPLIAGESEGERDWRKFVAAVAYVIFAFSPILAEWPYGWAIDRTLGSPAVAVSPADEAIKRDNAAAAKVDEPIVRDDVAAQNHGSMFICGTAVAIVVGMVLLLLLSRLIGRVQFSLGTAFWCSFSGHIFGTIIGLFMGFLFAYHMAIGLLIALAISWAFQTVIFQIFVRAKNGTLQQWRAAILSVVVILGDFLVASPLIALWEDYRTVRSPPVVATPADDAIERGRAAEKENDWDSAIAEYATAIRLNPKCAEAYNLRGSAYAGKRDWDNAVADCAEAIRFKPDFAEAHYVRGLAYGRKRDWDKAIVDCTEAIRLNPKLALAYFVRGSAYVGRRDRATWTRPSRIVPRPSASKPISQKCTTSGASPMQASVTWTRSLPIAPRPSASNPISRKRTTAGASPTSRRAKRARRKQTLRKPSDSGTSHESQ